MYSSGFWINEIQGIVSEMLWASVSAGNGKSAERHLKQARLSASEFQTRSLNGSFLRTVFTRSGFLLNTELNTMT